MIPPIGTRIQGLWGRWRGTVVESDYDFSTAPFFVRIDWLKPGFEGEETIGRIAPCFDGLFVLVSPLVWLAEQAE